MPTGFIYIVDSVTDAYAQQAFHSVPTQDSERLYFGPCKAFMRTRMKRGDYLFGISPARVGPRRIVFSAKIAERCTFAEAYDRFPHLRGPRGPIHVRPFVHLRPGRFPKSHYEFIPGSNHEECNDWERDLESPSHDAFFVCENPTGWFGRWLGPRGPQIDSEILTFVKGCFVFGPNLKRCTWNDDATCEDPIRYRNLYRGLHLETDEPEKLVALCNARVTSKIAELLKVETPEP